MYYTESELISRAKLFVSCDFTYNEDKDEFVKELIEKMADRLEYLNERVGDLEEEVGELEEEVNSLEEHIEDIEGDDYYF